MKEQYMDFSLELTLEQEFNLTVYAEQVKNMSQEQAQSYLVEVLRQVMVKDNLIKQLLVSNMLESSLSF
jgi:Phycobilisome degradation protein nblA